MNFVIQLNQANEFTGLVQTTNKLTRLTLSPVDFWQAFIIITTLSGSSHPDGHAIDQWCAPVAAQHAPAKHAIYESNFDIAQ